MNCTVKVQRFPDLFVVLRGVIDLRRRNGEATGQILLFGTVSGTGAFAKSGAGGGYEFALGTGR